jgi:hypothetical protein
MQREHVAAGAPLPLRRLAAVLRWKTSKERDQAMNERPVPGPERPRLEPEIIPPGDRDARARWDGSRLDFEGRGTQRIYVARLGPFGFAMVALVAALIAALALLVVVGAFVVLIPLAGALLAIAVFVGLVRVFWRQR